MRRLPPHVHREHPIVTSQYAIFTPAVDAFVEKLGDWIDSMITGAYTYGPSRFGKSRCIRFHLKRLLEERFDGPVPLHVWSRPYVQKTPAELYGSMLDGFKHGYGGKRSNSNERLKILMEYMLSVSDQCNSNCSYLIVDEAQGITTQEWSALMALQNWLDMEGRQLAVFSVASHQMAYEFDLLARTGNPHVAARLLVDNWKFPGIQSVEELAFILNGYDEDSMWPAQTGCSYLAHFSPKEFDRGRRLSTIAPVLWECLVALLPHGLDFEWNFPMKHVALAVEDTLIELAFGADWDEATTSESWIDKLTKHRFADHMRAIRVEF